MKTFTIEQIKKYLQSQDSFGDCLYNLSEANIDIANLPDDKIVVDDDYESGMVDWRKTQNNS